MRTLMLVALLAVGLIPGAWAQSFAGSYTTTTEDGQVTLKVEQTGSRLTGTFTEAGATMRLEGTVTGGTAKGTAILPGTPVKWVFTMKRSGGKLIVEAKDEDDPTDVVRYEFSAAAGGAEPPAKPEPARREKPAPTRPERTRSVPDSHAGGSATPPGWKTLKHPVGISIAYPGDWQVKEVMESTYQLVQPGWNPQSKEGYLVANLGVENVTSVNDPRIVDAADKIVAKIGPLLRRTGAPQTVTLGGKSAVIINYATNGAKGRLYIVPIKGLAITLLALGESGLLEARDALLRKIASAFGSGAAQLDQRLAGAWSYMGTSTIDARDNVGRLKASSVGDYSRSLQLRPDGTATSREHSRTIALGSGVAVDTGDQVTNKSGRWFAGNGKLGIQWENSVEQWTYRIVGRQLQLINEGKASIWEPR